MTSSFYVAIATSLLLVGCAGGRSAAPRIPGGGSTPVGSSAPDEDPAEALCRAERLAMEGDVAGAGATFVDDAHASIHALASSLQRGGRAADAGRLLEAKQRVEAAFAPSGDPSHLATLLAELRVAYVKALVASGAPAEEACA